MTTLVTGASGFVGGAVVRHLLAAGHTVRALVRPSSDRRALDGLDVEFAVGDLRDAPSLARACAGCERLFHVAADYRLWVPDAAALFASNVTGTVNLLRAAADAGVARIVYTSSVAVLGPCTPGQPADEQTPSSLGDMIGPYKQSKFQAEIEVRRRVREDRLPVVIVNPSTPVGPGDRRPTPTGRMVLDAAAGRMPAFVDTGLNIVHVDDVAAGHLLALDHGQIGARYILGGENLSLAEILTRIADLVGRPAPRIRLPHALVLPIAYAAEAWVRIRGRGEPLATVDGVRMSRKRMYFSSAKATRDLGYRARPAQEALSDAVAWFRDNGYF